MTPRAARSGSSSLLLRALRALPLAAVLLPVAAAYSDPAPPRLASTPPCLASIQPAESPPSCKVLPPVEVRLVPQGDTAPGSVARFTLEVVPRVGVPREVRVRWLPSAADLAWVEGERAATRPVQRDERQGFEVAVRVPTRGRQVLHCQVEVVTEDGVVWRRGVGVALGPEAYASRGRLVPGADGGTVLEFDAVPADRAVGGSR